MTSKNSARHHPLVFSIVVTVPKYIIELLLNYEEETYYQCGQLSSNFYLQLIVQKDSLL